MISERDHEDQERREKEKAETMQHLAPTPAKKISGANIATRKKVGQKETPQKAAASTNKNEKLSQERA